jgi:hypothetical protein
MSEGFEGAWPASGWETVDGDVPPALNGEYCWKNVPLQGYQSGFSAWPAAGCANGLDPAAAKYPNNANAWMVYGPFSLDNATAARVRFRIWERIAGQVSGGDISGDRLLWLASTDNVDFWGYGTAGVSSAAEPPTGDGWCGLPGGACEVVFDLSAVPHSSGGALNLVGQPQVWIAWAFQSDGSQSDSGPFVDDVVVEEQLAGGATFGGRGFGISRTPSSTVLTWTGGGQQTRYELARVPVTGGQPVFISVTGTAASYTDSSALTAPVYCYSLAPMSLSTMLGLSDSLCVVPRTRRGTGVPEQFTLRLNQSATASLSWGSPGGQSAYILAAVPMNGTGPRFVPLEGSVTSITDATGGVPTCYVLVAASESTVVGSTDVLCAVPGASKSLGGAVVATPVPATPTPGVGLTGAPRP